MCQFSELLSWRHFINSVKLCLWLILHYLDLLVNSADVSSVSVCDGRVYLHVERRTQVWLGHQSLLLVFIRMKLVSHRKLLQLLELKDEKVPSWGSLKVFSLYRRDEPAERPERSSFSSSPVSDGLQLHKWLLRQTREEEWAGAGGRCVIQADQDSRRVESSGPRWRLSDWLTASDGRLMRPSDLQSSCRRGPPPPRRPLLPYWCSQTLSETITCIQTQLSLTAFITHAHSHKETWHQLVTPALHVQTNMSSVSRDTTSSSLCSRWSLSTSCFTCSYSRWSSFQCRLASLTRRQSVRLIQSTQHLFEI